MKAVMLCALALFASVPVVAQDTTPAHPATTESVNQLMELTRVRATFAQVFDQTEAMIRSSVKESFNGQEITPERQAQIDDITAKSMRIMRETFNWDELKPLMIGVYQQSLSEDEVQGLIAFYRSPAGQAFIDKMPTIMRNMIAAMQGKQKELMVRMQKEVRDSISKTQSQDAKPGS